MTFTLKETKQLTDINSVGYLYEHDKTKSTMMFVKNDDDNTSFSISFATPPYNNNGIAHILEHSVLCGSRKYPTKEPFVELAKGSLNTFLNAFTSSDKTTYPVSSKNKKDFYNLVDVYLDAVFFPLLLENPQILAQEGWHYHLENNNDDLIYKGVVYNEMKGAYSDPNTVLYHAAKHALFPDTIYANQSGGYPLDIPTLTQEEFVQFHQTYYHPSNAFTFFYGDLDINEQLNHLEEYFSHFDYKSVDKQITLQQPFDKPQYVELPYSISADESVDKKTYLSLEFVVGQSSNIKDFVYYSILSDILIGSNASPLYKALMASGIGADIDGGINSSLPQMTFDISISNSEKTHEETFKNIVFDTLQSLVANGIDETLIKASINKNKFSIKEAAQQTGYPKGVYYSMSATNEWLYNATPFESFFVEDILNDLENNTHVFIPLIEQSLLNNPYYLQMTAIPKPGLNDVVFQEAHDKLQDYKQTLSKCDIDAIVEQTQALLSRQNTDDSLEALSTIPLLTLDDIDKHSKSITIEKTNIDDVTHLVHDTFTGGINYLTYYFDTKHISTEHIPYIQLFAKLLGELPTDNHSVEELSTLQDLHTGGIHFSTNIFVETADSTVYHPKFVVKAKSFENQFEWVIRLIHDMVQHTQFHHKDKLFEQLIKLKARHEAKFMYQSHMCATYRVRSYYSESAKYEEQLNGIDFYEFLCQLIQSFDESYNDIVAQLQSIGKQLVNRLTLTVGFIGKVDNNTKHLETFKQQLLELPSFAVSNTSFTLPVTPLNEGFILAQDVQYVAQGNNYTLQGLAYDSRLRVLKNILTYGYLWNDIRVKGGAYGAFNVQTRHGDFIFCSYRDPNFEQTINTYQNAYHFAESLNLDERELTKAIIGSFSELDRPLSPKETGEVGFMRHFTKTTQDDVQRERELLLRTTVDDLRQLAQHVKQSINIETRCVFGSKSILESQSHLLKSVKTLIK